MSMGQWRVRGIRLGLEYEMSPEAPVTEYLVPSLRWILRFDNLVLFPAPSLLPDCICNVLSFCHYAFSTMIVVSSWTVWQNKSFPKWFLVRYLIMAMRKAKPNNHHKSKRIQEVPEHCPLDVTWLFHIAIRASVITTGDLHKMQLVCAFIGKNGEGHYTFTRDTHPSLTHTLYESDPVVCSLGWRWIIWENRG